MKQKQNLQQIVHIILTGVIVFTEFPCTQKQEHIKSGIGKMSTEGIRFTQHYAEPSVCASSLSALNTGKHTVRTPVRGNLQWQPYRQYQLPKNTVSVASLLKNEGYKSNFIRKWDLGA